jgi:hypothetical protein
MRDKAGLVTLLGVSLGLASLALTVFAFLYVLDRHPSLRHQGRRLGAPRFSLRWSVREGTGGRGGLAVTEERTVGPFRGIDLRGSETVHVSVGSHPSLMVRASPGTVSEVVTEVENGVLVIRGKKPAWLPRSIDVYAVVKDLESLAVSGSGRILGESVFPGDELKIAVSGSGSIAAKVESQSVESRVTGSGRLTVSGKTRSHTAAVSGAGSIEGFDLETENTVIEIAGSGKAFLNVSANLDATVTGSGNVVYRGDPKVTEHVTGSGSVSRSAR